MDYDDNLISSIRDKKDELEETILHHNIKASVDEETTKKYQSIDLARSTNFELCN